MRLLIDEQLPVELRELVRPYDAVTVTYMKWKGVRNGELLRRAAEAGIDVLITNDLSLPFEQNAATLPCAVIVLNAVSNDIGDVAAQVPGLLNVLASLPPRSVASVPRGPG